jgi:hypothetical protein
MPSPIVLEPPAEVWPEREGQPPDVLALLRAMTIVQDEVFALACQRNCCILAAAPLADVLAAAGAVAHGSGVAAVSGVTPPGKPA